MQFAHRAVFDIFRKQIYRFCSLTAKRITLFRFVDLAWDKFGNIHIKKMCIYSNVGN